MTALAIVGAGGHGREVLLYSQGVHDYKFEDVFFLDDNEKLIGSYVCDALVLGTIEGTVERLDPEDTLFVCAVGSPYLRMAFVNRVLAVWGDRAKFANIVHSSIFLSKFVSLGVGSMVCPGTLVTTNVKIGNHVSVNLNCTLSHDVVIEDFVNLSPAVHLCGGSILREGCDIGAAVTVIPKVEIGEGAVVGAGACVISDIPPHSLAVGVPARIVRHNLNK